MRSEDLDFLKKEVRHYYKSLSKVYCPYFVDGITFNDDGFRHLSFKGNVSRQERIRKEQFVRFKLFKLAVKLLRITTTLQNYSERFIWIKSKRKKKIERLLQGVCYWTFSALINKKKIRVIVRQVGNGERHFWSVIPDWGNKKTSVTA